MQLLRGITWLVETVWHLPLVVLRVLSDRVLFNPRLGPVRYVMVALAAYVAFAIMLVYILAPIRAYTGQFYQAEKLHYDAERWVASAIYDAQDDFVGTFDPRLDSKQDVNFTDTPIVVGDYIANPDHKSIPVRDVPEDYWQCLKFHEDRNLGGLFNPFGIDLLGVLKIPYSTAMRSFRLGRPSLGVGGSTLPMQFARVIYKTPPRSSETPLEKLGRKMREWWIAPVIYAELTKGGDDTLLKQWAANHLWLAQRTGGSSLHGVEVAAQIVFGKQAKDLSVAEQFVLASAVNKPIILLEGSERLNAVRMDRWRYITEVRARVCAERLIEDPKAQAEILFELVEMAGGPPDPKVKPRLQEALERYTPRLQRVAQANPTIRANTLLPAARYGVREEMKQMFGFDWRNHIRSVTLTLDADQNLALRSRIHAELEKLETLHGGRIDPGFTLSPKKAALGLAMPDVVVVAADAEGRIVRYFENGQRGAYFGSPGARDRETGYYAPDREGRMIASTGKMLAAIAIANSGTDTTASLYLDTQAPTRGLETCARNGTLRRGRSAEVAFACSLNVPVLNRTLKAGQPTMARLIDAFGYTMPPPGPSGEGTPPATAAVLGQVSGSPQRVHNMSATVLASLIGKGRHLLRLPTLVREYDYITPQSAERAQNMPRFEVVPDRIISSSARPLLKALLSAPLCYEANGRAHGTLKSLKGWCAARRGDVRQHVAKTGTQVGIDPDATVDAWATGAIQFSNGAAYSYVVVAGTGASNRPWARSLHSSQLAAPLLGVLLDDLAAHARANPRADLLPKPVRRKRRPAPIATSSIGAEQTAGDRPTRPISGSVRADGQRSPGKPRGFNNRDIREFFGID